VNVTIKELATARACNVGKLVRNGTVIGQNQTILEKGRATSGKAMCSSRRQTALLMPSGGGIHAINKAAQAAKHLGIGRSTAYKVIRNTTQ